MRKHDPRYQVITATVGRLMETHKYKTDVPEDTENLRSQFGRLTFDAAAALTETESPGGIFWLTAEPGKLHPQSVHRAGVEWEAITAEVLRCVFQSVNREGWQYRCMPFPEPSAHRPWVTQLLCPREATNHAIYQVLWVLTEFWADHSDMVLGRRAWQRLQPA